MPVEGDIASTTQVSSGDVTVVEITPLKLFKSVNKGAGVFILLHPLVMILGLPQVK